MLNRRERQERREERQIEKEWRATRKRMIKGERSEDPLAHFVPDTPPLAPSAPPVDDFLPPDLRMPSREELTGMLMPWNKPLVIDGEVRTCPQCETYRDWIIISMRDDIWLRCRAGHETLERRLDTAWFNRNSGPMTVWHATLEDGLDSFGH